MIFQAFSGLTQHKGPSTIRDNLRQRLDESVARFSTFPRFHSRHRMETPQ
ncbi:hypothetical protein CLDAP_28770 [Caldilinea aerophila DSM 14535 = NBRC 104270]|uniref:Uncharacterized protein n=1 Tax=Caldilinea aerophila (strain DSM 14535 / JCM 11387 / NBRC 104270 / STL-6-O1) TaxID=926550 RepID=I0I6M9_CALAS|nr:hypothetical protein CLDAP_28770 [Caldilinea aerophila DSM 14535 = NBRC 104270]